tara:strand:+ start:199 stop:792 length:594 start_codon:yes stop_codon:yes gene_type:complete
MSLKDNGIEGLTIAQNIALVGSSDSILDEEYGSTIDSHTQVVRFNNAITEGFEKYVGSKTDLRVSNPHVFSDHPDHHVNKVRPGSLQYRIDNPKEPYTLVPANAYRPILLREIQADGIEGCPTAKKITKEYTVGFSFVLLCVRLGIIPNLFGFSLSMERRGTHYWQDREAPNMVGHDQLQEQQLLRELKESNKIKVF